MEKEALIDIILNDIKEVHALVNTFKGKNEINAAFINLTRTKIANISEELSLLEQLNVEKKITQPDESSLTSEALSTWAVNDSSAIAESSSRFAQGESFSVPETTDTDNGVTGAVANADSETIIAAGQTITSETHTSASEPKEQMAEKQTVEPAVQAKTSDTETITTTNETVTGKHETLERENQTKVADNSGNTGIRATTASNNVKKGAKPASRTSVLGEVIRKESASVNEAIASRKESVEDIKQIGKPVDDVRKAFGLNDRFYYQRELFSNNADLFNQTLEQINHMDSYDSAISFLRANYNWPADNEASESFYKSIKRRFI